MKDQFIKNLHTFCRCYNINYDVKTDFSLVEVQERFRIVQSMNIYQSLCEITALNESEIHECEHIICAELSAVAVNFAELDKIMPKKQDANKIRENLKKSQEKRVDKIAVSYSDALNILSNSAFTGLLFDLQIAWPNIITLLQYRYLLDLSNKQLSKLGLEEQRAAAKLMFYRLKVFVERKNGDCNLGNYFFSLIQQNQRRPIDGLVELNALFSSDKTAYLTASDLRNYYQYLRRQGFMGKVLALNWAGVVGAVPSLYVDCLQELIVLPGNLRWYRRISLLNLQVAISAAFIVLAALLNNIRNAINNNITFRMDAIVSIKAVNVDLDALYDSQSKMDVCFWNEYYNFANLYKKIFWGKRYCGIGRCFVQECQQTLIRDFYLAGLQMQELAWKQIVVVINKLSDSLIINNNDINLLAQAEKKAIAFHRHLNSQYNRLCSDCFINYSHASENYKRDLGAGISAVVSFWRRKGGDNNLAFSCVDRINCLEIKSIREEYKLQLLKEFSEGIKLSDNDFALITSDISSSDQKGLMLRQELTAALLSLCISKIQRVEKTECLRSGSFLFLTQCVEYFRSTQDHHALLKINRELIAIYNSTRTEEIFLLHRQLGMLNQDYYHQLIDKKNELESNKRERKAELDKLLIRQPMFVSEYFKQVYAGMIELNREKYNKNILPNNVIDSFFSKRKGRYLSADIIQALEATVIAEFDCIRIRKIIADFMVLDEQGMLIDQKVINHLCENYKLYTTNFGMAQAYDNTQYS